MDQPSAQLNGSVHSASGAAAPRKLAIDERNGNNNGSQFVTGMEKTSTSQKRKHSRAEAAYPRKRATQACRTCRLRRTKCDNARPTCTSCATLGAECTYQQMDPSTFDPASLAILKRIDELEVLINAKNTDSGRAPTTTTTIKSLDCSSPSVPRLNIEPRLLERGTEWKPLFINVESVLSWPVFDGLVSSPRLNPISPLEDDKPSPDTAAIPVSVDFELRAGDGLLRRFLDHVHIFNPILEEEEVKEYMRMVRFNGIGWDARSCLLLLICAHGSIATPYVKNTAGVTPSSFHLSEEFLRAESYFLAAQRRMGMLLCGSGVIEAQCFFLAGVYLMATIRPVQAWKMFVQALACCQSFSRDQRANRAGSEDVCSPQQRTYWTCFKSELELRLELNVSENNVWDLTYPAFFPSPPEGVKSKDEAAWYFYLAEIALRRLGNRILSYIYRYDSTIFPESNIEDAILDFEEQAHAWLQSLPPTLSLGVADYSDVEQYEAFRFILQGHFVDCQEMMYWHFVVDGIHGRLHGNAGEAFLQKGLKVCVERIEINQKGFFHRHHGAWLMMRSCTRSALVLLAAARRVELVPFLPVGWEDAIVQVKKMLNFWKDESNDILEMFNTLETLMQAHDDLK